MDDWPVWMQVLVGLAVFGVVVVVLYMGHPRTRIAIDQVLQLTGLQ